MLLKQQMASTMAYTSSWSGFENPNGSQEQIDENLLEAKKEVQALRNSVATVVDLLHLHEARFSDDLESAQKLIAYGESSPDKTILPRELATWTLVANLLLNLDEVVNKN